MFKSRARFLAVSCSQTLNSQLSTLNSFEIRTCATKDLNHMWNQRIRKIHQGAVPPIRYTLASI
jgi:hypothetical protein